MRAAQAPAMLAAPPFGPHRMRTHAVHCQSDSKRASLLHEAAKGL